MPNARQESKHSNRHKLQKPVWHNDGGSSYKLVIIRERANTIRHRSKIAVEVWHVLRRSSLARTSDLSRFIPARESRMHVSRIEYRVLHTKSGK